MTKKYPNFTEELINFTSMLDNSSKIYSQFPSFPDSQMFEQSVKDAILTVFKAAIIQFSIKAEIPATEFLEEQIDTIVNKFCNCSACTELKNKCNN